MAKAEVKAKPAIYSMFAKPTQPPPAPLPAAPAPIDKKKKTTVKKDGPEISESKSKVTRSTSGTSKQKGKLAEKEAQLDTEMETNSIIVSSSSPVKPFKPIASTSKSDSIAIKKPVVKIESITLGSSSEDELKPPPTKRKATQHKRTQSCTSSTSSKGKAKEINSKPFSIFDGKKAEMFTIPDSPPDQKKLKLNEPEWKSGMLMGDSSEKKLIVRGIDPLWPSNEEHGEMRIIRSDRTTVDGINSKVNIREENQSVSNGKGKESATETQFWHNLTKSLCSSTSTSPTPLRKVLHKQHPLSEISTLLPDLRNHPLLLRLAEPFLNPTPTFSDFLRPHERESNSNVVPQKCDWKDVWTSKYAPRSAGEVLGKQNGENAVVLKSWLEELAIWNARDLAAEIGKKRRTIVRTKVKVKNGFDSEGDDFIVDEDEEDYEGLDLGSDEERLPISTDLFPILTNLILLLGSVGTGKSSTVLALAEEMGWIVHQVNHDGIGKRGAKEIFELVGGAGKNHTVHGKASPQKHSMFMKKVVAEPVVARDVKQGLILFEEVDILYKQDKDFWPGLVDLVSKSQRPVILTCNDISLLPFNILPLQKFNNGERWLYFTSPEPSLAVPYLQLIALNEGHIISSDSLSQLYQSTTVLPIFRKSQNEINPYPDLFKSPDGLDLRKCINQLQFECQWGIGDEFIGLEMGKEKEIYTSWSVGAFDATNEVVEEDEIMMGEESFDEMMKRVEMISFADAFLSRRIEIITEIEEPDSKTAEIEGELSAYPVVSIPIKDAAQLSFLDKDITILSTLYSLIQPSPDLSTKKFDQARVDYVTLARSIIFGQSDLLIEPAPQLPSSLIFSDYLPIIRGITKIDHEAEKVENSRRVQGSKGKGKARVTRSAIAAGGGFERRFEWDEVQDPGLEEKILASGFLV